MQESEGETTYLKQAPQLTMLINIFNKLKFNSLVRVVIVLALIIVLFFSLYVVWFNIRYGRPQPKIVENAPVDIASYPMPQVQETLTVMTYNMGYASGPVQKSLNDPHPQEFFLNHLNQIVQLLKEQQVDILLLQEVDLNSQRTYYFNQLTYLQEQLGWNYVAQIDTWKKFVPFMGIGKIHSGGAILSKFPITNHNYRTFTFKPILPNKLVNFIYFPFVWENPVQHVTIEYQNTLIHLFNIHLEVWQRSYRVTQFNDLIDWIRSEGWTENIIIGGDFNFHAGIPLTGEQPKDYRLPPFFASIWRTIPGIQEAFINEQSTNKDIHQQVTFPGLQKRFDFLFFSKEFSNKQAKIIDLDASDHLPVMVKIKK